MKDERATVNMKPRPALAVFVLATAVPIVFISSTGLVSGATNLTASVLVGMFVVHGGVFAGVVAAAAGTFYSRRTLVMFGAALLSVESIPFLVDGLFVFTLLPSVVSLVLLNVEQKSDLTFS